MWNVRAVKKWENDSNTNQSNLDVNPYWWSPTRELLASLPRSNSSRTDPHDGSHHTCTAIDRCAPTLFVGQGRHVGYQGLAHSVVASISSSRQNDPDQLAQIATQTKIHLYSKPPPAWVLSSIGALALVWWEIGMALMISYNIPTVGIGCRSGSFILYGILSTLPWFAHLFECVGPQGRTGRRVSRAINWVASVFLAFSVPCLIFIMFAAVSWLPVSNAMPSLDRF